MSVYVFTLIVIGELLLLALDLENSCLGFLEIGNELFSL